MFLRGPLPRVLVNLCTVLGALVLVLGVLSGIWWLLWGESPPWDEMASPREGEAALTLPRHPQGWESALFRLEAVLPSLGAEIIVGAVQARAYLFLSARFPDNDMVWGNYAILPQGSTIVLTCTSVSTVQALARCRTIARAYTRGR